MSVRFSRRRSNPPPVRKCARRRENDEIMCATCQLRWSVDDKEPPQCPLKPA